MLYKKIGVNAERAPRVLTNPNIELINFIIVKSFLGLEITLDICEKPNSKKFHIDHESKAIKGIINIILFCGLFVVRIVIKITKKSGAVEYLNNNASDKSNDVIK